MTDPQALKDSEELQLNPTVVHGRREARVVGTVFVLALCYTTACSYFMGYARSPDAIRSILGFPDWILIGVVLPWALCTLSSWWFAFGFMSDDDLGPENSDDLNPA